MNSKIKKILITLCIVMLSFVLGIFANHYVSEYFRNTHYISGIVEYQSKPDPFTTGPAPEGYYVNSSVFGRVYVRHNSVSEYLGKNIRARGWLKDICGVDDSPCYPLIDAEWIRKQSIEPIEKPVEGGKIVDGLQLTIESVNAGTNKYGIYVFRKNEPFKIKVTLENRDDKDLNLLTPNMQNDYEKVFYFQLLDINGDIIETENREVFMSHTETIGPDKITLMKGEKHVFYAYLNSRGYGIEYRHHFSQPFAEGYYKLRGVYDTTGYKNLPPWLVFRYS